MLKLDENKLASLRRFDNVLNEKYGSEKSVERKEFDAKAKAWYYAELLKDERKKQNITQKSLAEKIGKKREYISALEKGQTDMQLSTFLKIADALGLRFSLVLGWNYWVNEMLYNAHQRCPQTIILRDNQQQKRGL